MARTAQVRFGGERTVRRAFRVLVQGSPRAYSGILYIVDHTGASSVRTFKAEDCQSVVIALALVAALSVDPNASTAPGMSSLSAAPAPSAAARRISPPLSDSRPPDAPREVGDWFLSAGATFDVLPEVTPVALIAIGGFLGVERTGHDFSSSFRLNPYFAQTDTIGPAAEAAAFYLAALRAEGCPVSLALGQAIRAWPCASVDVGLLNARGADIAIARPDEKNTVWVSAMFGLRLELAPSDAIFFEASGGPVLPVTRPRFVFLNPEIPVHEVPWLTAHAGISVGTKFP